MVYKKGQQLKASDANRFVEHLNADPISRSVFENGVQTLAREIVNRGRVILQPLQALGEYETMKGLSLLGIDTASQQPKMQLSNLQEQTVTDGANTFYATCGSTPIGAGQPGYGEILHEGYWYWLKAESGVTGYCGLAPGSNVLKQDYFGFLSLGTITANGITLAYATTYNGQMFRMKTKVGGIGAGTFAKAFVMKPSSSGWTLTSLELDVWSPAGATAADKEIIVGYVNGRLMVIVEPC